MNNTLLRELNEKLAVLAIVPSSNTTIKIKPISIKQIKNIVDKSLEITYFDIGFKRAIANTLKENIISDVPVVLTEADVNILFMYLKSGGTYRGVKINEIIAKHAQTLSGLNLKKTLELDSIRVELSTPSFDKVTQLEDFIIKNIQVDEEGTLTNEQETGTVYFLIEILKNVTSLKINEVELIQDKELSEQLSIIQELPYQIANEIVSFTQDLQTSIDKLLIYNDDFEIPFDISFFE